MKAEYREKSAAQNSMQHWMQNNCQAESMACPQTAAAQVVLTRLPAAKHINHLYSCVESHYVEL